MPAAIPFSQLPGLGRLRELGHSGFRFAVHARTNFETMSEIMCEHVGSKPCVPIKKPNS